MAWIKSALFSIILLSISPLASEVGVSSNKVAPSIPYKEWNYAHHQGYYRHFYDFSAYPGGGWYYYVYPRSHYYYWKDPYNYYNTDDSVYIRYGF